MEGENVGMAVWLASYPKSGNTWLRLLLEAYHRNGLLDINDLRTVGTGDGNAAFIRGVCPAPFDALSLGAQLLLRPAALMNLLWCMRGPKQLKTHFANIRPDGDAPHCIPKMLTSKAVYIVRDPRSVVMSASRHFKFPIDAMVATMNHDEFTIGDGKLNCNTLVSTWSNHVRSWVGEKAFPVHVLKYEDMMVDAAKELTAVLEFLEEEVDHDRVKRAVEATELSRLRKAEEIDGFTEKSTKAGAFFTEGGSRWQDELGPKWIKQLEEDHGDVMRSMGYLDAEVVDLRAVE